MRMRPNSERKWECVTQVQWDPVGAHSDTLVTLQRLKKKSVSFSHDNKCICESCVEVVHWELRKKHSPQRLEPESSPGGDPPPPVSLISPLVSSSEWT